MRTSFDAELPNLTWHNTYGDRVDLFVGGQPWPSPKGAECPQSPISGVILYLWLHYLKKNGQIGRGKIHGAQSRHPYPKMAWPWPQCCVFSATYAHQCYFSYGFSVSVSISVSYFA